MWNRIKGSDGKFKYDIDSIIEEQVNFYSNLFTTEGWDEKSARELLLHVKNRLSPEDRDMLDHAITLEEVFNVLKILKPNKSPGEDGIISEFYLLYWNTIKAEFMSLLREIFEQKRLSDSQYKGVLTLLHKGGERDNIKNWRPLTLLNCDYKIIAKILAERLKIVLPKLIHTDQKGFIKGRNIADANRLIQDIIQYIDQEDEEAVIIFLDQQKAFDRMEWGWLDMVLKTFNFGDTFCGWVNMLFKHAKTCIKTNGFLSKYFTITRSARQGCPIAPLLYILQAEPMACAMRENDNIKGIVLPGEGEGEFIETKLCMFADDTQLFNKDENSVENSFQILATYEKASGSKINFEKTKGLKIGTSKNKKFKFNKISWTVNNVKTLGVHHGFNIDIDEIWRAKIEKIKNCLHVWKSRHLTFSGKTLIIKNFIISLCGYQIDMVGIPAKYINEINRLLWDFIWDGKVHQVNNNVCCAEVENGGMGMVDFSSFVETRRIKSIYRILHSPLESWNALGKYWLQKLDKKFDEKYFLCNCSNLSGLNLNNMPSFYRDAVHTWTFLSNKLQLPITKEDILDLKLFGNANIIFDRKPLFFPSFSKSGIKTIRDIWDNDSNEFRICNDIFDKLFDKRNCISEYSRIKIAIPQKFIHILRNGGDLEHNISHDIKVNRDLIFVDPHNKPLNINQICLKLVQSILNAPNIPKCQLKWESCYNKNLPWETIWGMLKQIDIDNKVKEFQWKCVHRIIYTEHRLKLMNKSNGKCHYCHENDIFETQQHLFYDCKIIKRLLKEIKHLLVLLNLISENEFSEEIMIFGFQRNIKEDFLLNTIIFYSKWTIWKLRNTIKFDRIQLNFQLLYIFWRKSLKNELNLLIKKRKLKYIEKFQIANVLDKL